MNINTLHTIYFLGVGGIGMSALARYFLAQGCKVSGYDKTKTKLTEQLCAEGVAIHYEEDENKIPVEIFHQINQAIVVYTPAIPKNHKEWLFLQEKNIKCYKRSEILGFISQKYFTIAVAGTHGKTTTSSMIAHVLNQSGVKCNAFLGGISLNFNSNLLLHPEAEMVVVEADEFDRSFLTLTPNIAVVTSLDADHLDVYSNKQQMDNAYKEFVQRINPNGVLITKQAYRTALDAERLKVLTYSIEQKADFSMVSKKAVDGNFSVALQTPSEKVNELLIGLPGIHNIENGIAAYAVAKELGIDTDLIIKALASYKGVK